MRGWKFTRNMFLIPNIISTAAIGLIFLNLYSPARGIVTELCNLIWPGSDVSVLSNSKYAFWGVTFTFILFGGSNCLLLLTQIFPLILLFMKRPASQARPTGSSTGISRFRCCGR